MSEAEVNECLERVNKQKDLIEQMKAEKLAFDKMAIGHRNLIAYMDWLRLITSEETILAKYRAQLSEARGE